jgi:GntR family transcriptional regulator, transcriptional repressor for pyruvate dehydrogenase complex
VEAGVTVTDAAIEKIKSMIVSGRLQPGDRLPVEKVLAAELGLSRNSLREAIRALTVLRILETRQGAGTYVTSLAPSLILDAVSFIVAFHDPKTALEFLDTRRVLESEAAARSSRRVTDDDLDRLREVNELLHQLASAPTFDSEAFLSADKQFHRVMAESCGNSALAALVVMLGGQTEPARMLRVAFNGDVAGQAAREHDGILDALRRRDPDRARSRTASHILNLEDWLESELQKR